MFEEDIKVKMGCLLLFQFAHILESAYDEIMFIVMFGLTY